MKGKILIVAGSILQVPAVKAAKELGLYTIVTDVNPDCACAPLADEFHQVDIFDAPGHITLAARIDNLYGVFTCACDATVTVAKVSDAMGLHGLPVGIAERCKSKAQTRAFLKYANVPQPETRLTSTLEDAQAAVKELGSSIVKATGGSGGRGHTRAMHPTDVTEAVFDNAKSRGGVVLVEQMLHGLELSVESLWFDGAMYPLNAVERPFAHRAYDLMNYTASGVDLSAFGVTREAADKYAIELGHFNPAILSRSQWGDIWEIMMAAGVAVGMDRAKGGHIFKGDLILTDDGPKVLEVTPRLSGNFDSGRTTPLALGADYTKGAIGLALGKFPDWQCFIPRWHRHAVCLSKFAPPGVVKAIRGLDKARRNAEVIIKRGIGSTVPELTNYAAQVAYVIADGHVRAEAMGKAMRALELLHWETE